MPLYEYRAKDSNHKGHIVEALKWGKGKALFWCHDCGKKFLGIRRTIKKILK